MDTLDHLLTLHLTPAYEQDRAQVDELARQVQEVRNSILNWPLWISDTHSRKCCRDP